jgi:hypothetical protein
VTGRDAEREQLAAALAGDWGDERFEIAVALLPVVDRIANDRAAAALEAAADDMPGKPSTNPAQDWLLARAAALRASNGAGT